jgi:hypothetical protein
MRLPRAAFQEALTDGTVRNFLKGLIPNPLEYPSWVRGHESPEHEAIELRNPGEVELWLDPRQQNSPYPTGHEVHTTIKKEDLLERSLSFGDLKWYEENQDRIPAEFKGKLVHGWASVVRSSDGSLRVPCLDCDVGRPYVVWYNLVFGWFGYEPAGLRK